MYSIQITRLSGSGDLPLPKKMSPGSSGFDLYAAVQEPCSVHPGDRILIPTGIAVAMPLNIEAQVRSRSGLALKYGVFVLNSPGTIDSDYRGEIRVILHNAGSDVFHVRRGDRIAQLVFQEVPEVSMQYVDTLDETDRGTGGFGSTGY